MGNDMKSTNNNVRPSIPKTSACITFLSIKHIKTSGSKLNVNKTTNRIKGKSRLVIVLDAK